MNACDTDVANSIHVIAHHFGGQARFFQNGNVAGTGTDDNNFSLSANRAIAPHAHYARGWKILCFGRKFCDSRTHLLCRSRQKKIGRLGEQRGGDAGHLIRIFALPKNYFRHAVANGAMMIDLCETEIFEREITQSGHGGVYGSAAISKLF